MSAETKPRVLIVYYTLTKQSGRVADAMAKALEARGCEVTKAMIEFTDERWVPKLSQFPMKRPFPQIASILPAQLRHKTGEIRIPPEAQAGDYDLVRARVSDLVVPDEHADPLLSRVARGEGGAGRQAVRIRVDLSPLLQHQPPAAEEARREERRAVRSTRHTSSSPAARSSRCSRGSGT